MITQTARRTFLLGGLLSLLVAAVPLGCSKEETATGTTATATDEPATSAAETQAAETQPAKDELPPLATDGTPRKIAITVTARGYEPDRMKARAGETLLLEFTRKDDSECTESVIVEGKTTPLPVGEPVEIPLTMPKDGELVFTCGMKMLEGTVTIVN